ncbi:hypothetical protein SAMN04487886_12012 [Clostridium sp. DSM 8431]|uniref:SPASM domain-containing protein n=1 Tax=Clostridium sp. DSM 8431 TaxID=1761781 RepID=UPI0008DFD97B|nr:SPASM domain-containing protein [Clostridium sp. DSM 8431]SFU83172.1 hypothetical protein SAMN04487886_12012 [Clostridium sp. DSM 8431]
MRTGCLVNFNRDINGLWTTRYNAESCILEKYIRSKGINTYVYSEKDITSVVDICEDILAFTDEVVILITDNENLLLNLSLAKQIESEEPDCQVVLYSVEELDERYKKYIKEDYVFISDDFEKNICEVFDIDYEGEKLFLEEYSQFNSEKELGRFNEKVEVLIGRKEKGKYISRNLNSILKDIDIVGKSSKGDKVHVELSGMTLDNHEYRESIYNAIKENQQNIIFEAKISMEFIESIKEDIPENLLVSVVFNKDCAENKDIETLEKYKNRIAAIFIKNELIYQISDNEEFIKYVQANNLGSKVINGKDKYWEELDITKVENKKINQKLDKEFQTFSTGFAFSQTGEYINVPLNGFVKHVKINSEDINEDVLNFLDEACSVNSSIFVTGDKEESNLNLYHVESLKKIYKKENWIENIREKSIENQSFPKNLITINNDVLDVNGIVNNIRLKFNEISYCEFKDSYCKDRNLDSNQNTDLVTLTINTEKDFARFIEEVDRYYESKSISHSSLLYARMKNACRFLSRNYCSLTKVPRIEIDSDGNVYSCYEKEKPLGTIEDSIFDITQSAYVEHETKLRKNSCSKCSAAIGCAKCACMPDFMKEQYCYLMINKPYITDFILESMVICNSKFTNREISNIPVEKIKVSNEHIQNLLNNYEDGHEAPFFAKYVFVILTDSFYAVWSPNTNRIYKISKEIALIAEALLKRMEPNEIIKVIADEANLSMDVSTQLCKQVFELFYKNNLLYRQVQI